MRKTTSERFTIVLAWTDTDGIRKTGRMVMRDMNWFPEIESCLQAKTVIWLNKGTAADVEKARAYAAKCGHDNATVFTYETSHKDPRGAAAKAVLAIASKEEVRS